MALQGRHRYIVQKLDEAFEIHDENATEALVQTEPVLEKINHFFRGDGPSRLIFYYVHSGSDPYGDPYHELIVSDGSNLPLAEKAVFFLKTVKAPTPGSDESIPPDLDPTTATDGALSYGVVAAALPSLETAVERLYKPLLSAQTEREWGLAQGTERIEFLTSLDSLVASLQESAKSANSNLELATPDADLEQQVSAPDAASDPALVAHLANMVEDWCLQVEALLNGGNSGSGGAGTGGVGSGPDTEIEYWRRRLQQLTSVTDQLKARPCKNVLAVLTAAASMKAPTTGGNNAAMVNKARSLALLRQWRQVDVKLTESSNEAKDNVKWLATLERYMEPLYSGDPEAILDLIPALIGSVKMIHTASRFYNTSQRIGALLASFSYQIMAACTLCVNGKDPPDALFDRPPEFVLRVLESCLKLNEKFQEQYHLAKDQLQAFPKGKQFDFSEFLLFGTLDAFCRRAVKLMDVFASVQQFQALASARVEGSASLLVAHDATLTAFRKKNHPLLDVSEGPAQARCEAELAQLLVQLDANEVQLKALVDTSFAHAISAEARLDLLATYAPVLKRPELKAHLDAKLQAALVAYASELAIVQSMYEHDKHAPPVPRNTPPVAGAVAWCRQLLRRIDAPMQRFQASFSKAKDDPSSQPPPAAFKPIVKTYNKVARALVSFEYVWLDAWQKSVHSAQEGLQATLVVKHPKTGKLFVNLDREVLQLAHESKCLRRLGVELPDAALAVLAQEAHIKDVALRLGEMLESFAAATEKILPVTLKCLASHISVVEDALRPGLVSLTWTSLNVRTYLDSVGNAVAQLSELIGQVNDLVDNRIDRPLSAMAQVALIKLPDPADERLLSLDTFIEMQELAALSATATLQAKNSAVEAAVGDLVALIVEKKNLNSTSNSAASSNVPAAALSQLRAHYNALAYRALLSATRNALNATKKRVCSRAGSGFLFAQRPLFEVDIQLSVPSVRLSPTLDDVQHAINRTAVTVMACSKRVWQWGQLSVPEAEKRSFFDILGCDLEIIKVSLLLTGALHNTKSAVSKYLSTFRMYDWIWKEDKDEAYQRFLATTPMTADFEAEVIQRCNVPVFCVDRN
jgi:dynein heavy chain